MSHKEWFVKMISQKLFTPEKIINAVVTHQFDSANEALKTNNSIEIYDFGKFIFNERKAKLQYEKFCMQKEFYETLSEDASQTEQKRRNARLKLETTIKNVNDLKLKIEASNDKDF